MCIGELRLKDCNYLGLETTIAKLQVCAKSWYGLHA